MENKIGNVNYINEVIMIMDKYSIDKKDIIFVGSAVQAVLEIRKNSAIDIMIRPNKIPRSLRRRFLFSYTSQISSNVKLYKNRYRMIAQLDKFLFKKEAYFIVDDFRFADLSFEFHYKKKRKLYKDIIDIDNIKKFYLSNNVKQIVYPYKHNILIDKIRVFEYIILLFISKILYKLWKGEK